MSDKYASDKRRKKRFELHLRLRIFLIFSHILIITIGFVLILIGFMNLLISKILSHKHTDSLLIIVSGACQVGLGVSLLMMGIFGCVVSYFYSYSHLEGYAYFMVFFGLTYFTFTIFQIITYQSLLDWDDKRMVKLQVEASETISWKYLQSNFGCCGYNTYSEWFNASTRLWVPIQCCRPVTLLSQMARVVDELRCFDDVNRLPKESAHFYTKGCKVVVKGIIGLISVFINITSLFLLFLLNGIFLAARRISGVL